jgi:hypothetical protein
MASWFLKMFLKILKPFAKIGIFMALIQQIEEMLKGSSDEEESTDAAVPEA